MFPAQDFAALGNQPHWIVGFAPRPDQSVTNHRTAYLPDNEIRLSTTGLGLNNLSLQLDDNLGSDAMLFYSGPLTMVAEWHFGGGRRDLTGREKTKRLAMAQWMMENGSDVHQGGDGPLMRAALFGARIPMMELLVQHGVRAELHHAERGVLQLEDFRRDLGGGLLDGKRHGGPAPHPGDPDQAGAAQRPGGREL